MALVEQYLTLFEARFLDLFFPKRCVACNAEGAWACVRCLELTAALSKSRRISCGSYPVFGCLDFNQPLVRELLHNLKYNGIVDASEDLLNLFGVCSLEKPLQEWLKAFDPTGSAVIIPVPITRKKRKARGYNQAEELAIRIGKILNLPVHARMLSRKGSAESQVGKGREERMQGLSQVFEVNVQEAKEVEDRMWLIVDDLYTTGSTMRACFTALAEYGRAGQGGITMAYKRF